MCVCVSGIDFGKAFGGCVAYVGVCLPLFGVLVAKKTLQNSVFLALEGAHSSLSAWLLDKARTQLCPILFLFNGF